MQKSCERFIIHCDLHNTLCAITKQFRVFEYLCLACTSRIFLRVYKIPKGTHGAYSAERNTILFETDAPVRFRFRKGPWLSHILTTLSSKLRCSCNSLQRHLRSENPRQLVEGFYLACASTQEQCSYRFTLNQMRHVFHCIYRVDQQCENTACRRCIDCSICVPDLRMQLRSPINCVLWWRR